MKLLVCLLIVCPALCLGQEVVPKKSEGVVLTSSLSDSLLFERAVSLFDREGFTVSRSDLKRGIITTDPKSAAGLLSMRIVATIKEKTITMKGQYSGTFMGVTASNKPVVNGGGAAVKGCFAVLDKTAQKLKADIDGSVISYLPATD